MITGIGIPWRAGANNVLARRSAIINDPILAPTAGAKTPDPLEFESRLFASMDEFRKLNVRGVWLRIPPALAEFIPPAVRAGFSFHSARPEAVTLTAVRFFFLWRLFMKEKGGAPSADLSARNGKHNSGCRTRKKASCRRALTISLALARLCSTPRMRF